MNPSTLLEILIAAEDHRVLSANAEAWALVSDSVFHPIDQYLTAQSSAMLDDCLRQSEGRWFPLVFQGREQTLFFARTDASGTEDPGIRRLTLAPADRVMEEYLETDRRIGSICAMLGLDDDLYFFFDPEAETVTLYNAGQSRYAEGTASFLTFEAELRSLCDEDSLPKLNAFLQHVRSRAPRYRVLIPCNLFNRDPEVTGTLIKCSAAHLRDGSTCVVGLMHPQRIRGSLAEGPVYDPLTGVFNKEHITNLAMDRIERLKAAGTTLGILDIDFFKNINDSFGHQVGDEVLREVADIIRKEIGSGGLVGRIGGDEFFLLIFHASLPELRAYLRSIKSVVSAAFLDRWPGRDKSVTVSIGTATYPQDADNYQDLFMIADFCLQLAKEKGRNRYIHYTPEKHPSLEQIRQIRARGDRVLLNGRDDLPLGDALVQLQYMIRYSHQPPLETVLREFTDRFSVPLSMICLAETSEVVAAAGVQLSEVSDPGAFAAACLCRPGDFPEIGSCNGMLILNNVDQLQAEHASLRDALLQLDIRSLILIPFTDRAGHAACLLFCSLHRHIFWNEQHHMVYRLFADALCAYDVAALPEPDGDD